MALKYLRDNLKSLTWVLWAVILVFVGLVFFEWGGFNMRGSARTDIAATVGGEEITLDELRQHYRNLESRYRQAFGEQFNREMARQFNLPKQALDQLIDRRIMLLEARQAGLRATDGEIREAILAIPGLTDEDGRFIGDEKYRRIVRSAFGTSTGEFEASVREDVLIGKLDTILTETAHVSDAEVEQAYREQAERAKIRYLQLPESELISEVRLDDADLETYFAEHRDDYQLPEKRVVEYLLVDSVKLRREIEIPGEELEAYYQANQGEFTSEEQVRARHILLKVTPDRPDATAESELQAIRRRVEGGEDFGQLAQQLSEDEVSASRGGSLGLFGRGRMIQAFEEAAFSAAVGDLVGPIKTDFGYHLIEVQEHRPGGLQPFDQVEAVVRSRVIGERVEEISEEKARDVAQRIQTEGLSAPEQLQALAEEESLTLEATEPFGREETVTGIGRSPDFSRVAFELATGESSEPVKIPRGWVILRLMEIQPPRASELSEVEAEVRRAAEQEKRKAAAVARLEELRGEHEAAGGLEDVAAGLGLEIRESAEFGRFGTIDDLGSNRQVIDTALALEPGNWGGPFESADGAVMFEVLERTTFDPEEFEKAKEETRSQEQTRRLDELRRSLIALRRDGLASYDRQVLERLGIELPDIG